MADHMMVFVTVLAVNLLIVIIYLLWNILFRKKENNRSYWIRSFIMILCPVVGICFFLLAHIFYLMFFSEPVDLEDVIFSKERVRTFIHADEESERNMVPLEEAIEVTDTEALRTLMVNIVRGDIKKSLATIALALNGDDTETAHYAASVLQDALNEFRTTVQKDYLLVKDENTENRQVVAGMLIGYMNDVLEQKVLTDIEQVAYVEMMEEVCEILYSLEPERMTSSLFEFVSLRLLEIKRYDNSQKWCERAAYQYPNTLATYTCQLKLYFNSGQKERFFEVIEELKKSAIVIDNETLELIRVFR